MNDKIIFVPGRISLIGGISDLVSPYLSLNKDLIPGCAIAVAIDKGIYSSACKNEKFIYDFGNIHYECDMEENLLKNGAENNDYFSYMCGTLLYMLKNYNISGLKLKIVKMDLPIKKGLASSAAICITIAQWINILVLCQDSRHEKNYFLFYIFKSGHSQLFYLFSISKSRHRFIF